MKHAKGSALLIVLALMGLTSALVMHAWFITSLQYDIVQQRELWYKNFYAAEIVLNVGLVHVSKQFELFVQCAASSSQPLMVDLSRTLGHDGVIFVTKCNDRVGGDGLVIRTNQLQCKLSKVVSKKEIHFVASHFTIRTGV